MSTYSESSFCWEPWDSRDGDSHKMPLPSNGCVVIELGKDRHGRMMRLQVSQGRGPDGTRGVEIRGEHLLRVMSAGGCNTVYVTEQDPRDVPVAREGTSG